MDATEALRKLLGDELIENEPMSRHTTLKVGGPARWFWVAREVDKMVQVLDICREAKFEHLFIGHGSNILMSDRGYGGLVIQNKCKGIEVGSLTTAESGVTFGSLFHTTARAGYSGLEWAVGIPGTVGGALVSNAGAYRGNIGPLVRSVRVYFDGFDQTVGPEWMEFSYRQSRLRLNPDEPTVLLSCVIELKFEGDADAILARAKRYQDLRRAKQPFDPSAGSFFKNVVSKSLAESLPGLPAPMKEAGVIPAGYLIEACGLKGAGVGGARVSEKHANFLVNCDRTATAADLRSLVDIVNYRVREEFGVVLEEEVLYCGDWSDWDVSATC